MQEDAADVAWASLSVGDHLNLSTRDLPPASITPPTASVRLNQRQPGQMNIWCENVKPERAKIAVKATLNARFGA